MAHPNDEEVEFKFAPKSSLKPGLYFINFATTFAGFSMIPPLRVKVDNTKCSVPAP